MPRTERAKCTERKGNNIVLLFQFNLFSLLCTRLYRLTAFDDIETSDNIEKMMMAMMTQCLRAVEAGQIEISQQTTGDCTSSQ